MIVVDSKMKNRREAGWVFNLPESYSTWTKKSSPKRNWRLEIQLQGNSIYPVLKNLGEETYKRNGLSVLLDSRLKHQRMRMKLKAPEGREHLYPRFKEISRVEIAPLLPYLLGNSFNSFPRRVRLKNTVLQGAIPLFLLEASVYLKHLAIFTLLGAITTGLTPKSDTSRIIQSYVANRSPLIINNDHQDRIAYTYITLLKKSLNSFEGLPAA